jgi:hypothetical protein
MERMGRFWILDFRFWILDYPTTEARGLADFRLVEAKPGWTSWQLAERG